MAGRPAPTTSIATCIPTNNPALTSPDPNCFDGNATDGIFVSGIGDDSNPGTMALPKRTLAAGVSTAAAQGKDVYVTKGVYPETLNVANGVSVYGGYDASWQRSPANVTKITGTTFSGDSEAATAFSVTSPTTLQLLTLAPSAPTSPGATPTACAGPAVPGSCSTT